MLQVQPHPLASVLRVYRGAHLVVDDAGLHEMDVAVLAGVAHRDLDMRSLTEERARESGRSLGEHPRTERIRMPSRSRIATVSSATSRSSRCSRPVYRGTATPCSRLVRSRVSCACARTGTQPTPSLRSMQFSRRTSAWTTAGSPGCNCSADKPGIPPPTLSRPSRHATTGAGSVTATRRGAATTPSPTDRTPRVRRAPEDDLRKDPAGRSAPPRGAGGSGEAVTEYRDEHLLELKG